MIGWNAELILVPDTCCAAQSPVTNSTVSAVWQKEPKATQGGALGEIVGSLRGGRRSRDTRQYSMTHPSTVGGRRVHTHRTLGISKSIKIAIAIVIPLTAVGTFVAVGGAASASTTPVTFKGSISCSLTGTATFKPGLTLTKATTATSSTATFKGKNVNCKGITYKGVKTSLTQGNPPETLKSSTENFTFKIAIAVGSSGCAGLASGAAPAITGAVVTWIGTSPITPTKMNFKAGTITTAGLITYTLGTVTSGSFPGTAKVQLQASMVSSSLGNKPYTIANALAACKAPGGLTDMVFVQPKPSTTFPLNDNEEIGAAF